MDGRGFTRQFCVMPSAFRGEQHKPQTRDQQLGVLRTLLERKARRLYRLDILTAPTDVPGRARRARFPDRELLRAWYRAFAQEADERIAVLDDAVDAALKIPGCWLWVDANGVIVSMATRRPMMT
jgi:hypothetical protein